MPAAAAAFPKECASSPIVCRVVVAAGEGVDEIERDVAPGESVGEGRSVADVDGAGVYAVSVRQ